MANELVQNLSADAWAATQRFYAPMPFGVQSPVAAPVMESPRLLVPVDMPDWQWTYACNEINRKFGGVPPMCAECDVVILCYPFHAVECREWVKCEGCYYTGIHRGHNGRCARSKYCQPGC